MKCVIRADLGYGDSFWNGKHWTYARADALVYDSEEQAHAEIAANVAEDGVEGVWGEDAGIVPAE